MYSEVVGLCHIVCWNVKILVLVLCMLHMQSHIELPGGVDQNEGNTDKMIIVDHTGDRAKYKKNTSEPLVLQLSSSKSPASHKIMD